MLRRVGRKRAENVRLFTLLATLSAERRQRFKFPGSVFVLFFGDNVYVYVWVHVCARVCVCTRGKGTKEMREGKRRSYFSLKTFCAF